MSLFFAPFDLILSSASKLRLLRALHATHSPMSGREVASAAGIAVQPAQRALAALVAAGVVRRNDTRSQHLYSLNRENYLVRQSISPLFEAEHERVGEVFRELGQAAGPFQERLEGVYLYGSAARGRDAAGSDFDVLAVTAASNDVDAVHEKLADLAPDVYTRYGLVFPSWPLTSGSSGRCTRRATPLRRNCCGTTAGSPESAWSS